MAVVHLVLQFTADIIPQNYLLGKKQSNQFMDYICKLRLQQVCYYLMSSDKNIGEIAQLCGFCTPNYLIKLFRRAFNRTPMEYRKQRTRFPRPYDGE